MAYDWREIIFRDLQAISPEDPFYFSRRFRKAMLILNSSEVEELASRLGKVKANLGFSGQSLDFIEKKLRTRKAIKIRSASNLVLVTRERAMRSLNALDDWLDEALKRKAGQIRWSHTGDLGRSHVTVK